MPRILRIINRFNLGGPTYNAAYLTRYLNSDFETLLVGGTATASEAPSTFIAEELGLEPRVLNRMSRSISLLNDYSTYRELRQLIREYRPDIVHTHASKAGALGRLAAIREKVPVIVHTFHGNVFKGYFGPVKTGVYKKLERYLARKSSAIIAISDLQKEELTREHRIAPEEKVQVIPLGFDLSRFHENQAEKRLTFRSRYGIDENTIAVGIVGRLVPIKNHRLFIEAMQQVWAKSPVNVRAFIVGDGESRAALEAFCRERSIVFGTPEHPVAQAPLTFTSWIKEADMVNAGIDIAALSSDNEGTPVSLIEAQAAGCPVVSTRVGGIANIVLPEETALLSAPGEANDFAQHILQLATDPAQRAAMRIKGWPFVKERFHYTRLVSDMERLYRSLLDKA